jgi:TonB-linked SusC/RagA family outer membrane protein
MKKQVQILLLKKKFLLSLFMLVFCFATSEALAQERTISGNVTSTEEGEPLPGVNVLVKGTSIGTVTDMNGDYRLSVPSEASTLVFSFIGLETQEVQINNRSVVDVQMESDALSLSEVVVTGYTTQERREITGAVSTVKAKDLVAIPAGNVEQQLQGRVAGVTVLTSGAPGDRSMVRIRGFGSFTNNAPLFVVDGVPTYDVGFLNSGDIETTTVLKDAGSASIYGARASSGVVILTTKKGTSGKLKVSYDAQYGVQAPGKGFETLTPQETADLTWLALNNSGIVDPETGNPTHPQYGSGPNAVLPDYILPAGAMEGDPGIDFDLYNIDYDNGPIYQITRANKQGTDWFDEVTQTAPIQSHTLGFSGGSDAAKYYLGLGYYDQQGVVINTFLKRYTLRANTQFNIKDRVRIGENVQVFYRKRPGFTNLSEGNAISMAYRMNPIVPVYDEMGNYAGTRAPGTNNPNNAVAIQQRNAENQSWNGGIFGSIYAEVDIMEGLTARSNFGGSGGFYHNYFFTYRTYENSENNAANSFSENAGYGYSWVWTNTLNYEKRFNSHKISALAGVESLEDDIGRSLGGRRLNYFTDNPDFRTLSTGDPAGQTNYSNGSIGYSIFSAFGKVDYGFDDKYLLSLTLRRDGSSNFGAENKYGTFPAVSAAWRITGEEFMSDTEWLNDMKIRGGWGIMGNQRIPAGNQYGLFDSSPAFSAYDITGTSNSTVAGLRLSRIGNPLGRWEENITTNIGIDATLFNNSFEIIFDIWKRRTEGLLYNPEVPAVIGYLTQYPYINVGEIENKGIDLQLIKKGRISSDFKYNVDLTFATYKNEILAISEGVDNFPGPSFGSSRIGTFTRNEVGHPISSFFGYNVIGIFQDENDVTNSPEQPDAAPGRFKYEDVDGDGEITSDDRKFFGDPNPDFTYGLNLTLGYKNFDFEMFFYGVQGQDIINYTRWFTDFYSSFPGGALNRRALDNAWSENNPGGTTPIAEATSTFSTNSEPNSYYLEDGSYLRARNVRLGYTIPTNLINRYGIEGLKLYIQATNLFTLTGYTGLDPAISGVDTNFGVDYGNYPFTRQFMLGVNLNF